MKSFEIDIWETLVKTDGFEENKAYIRVSPRYYRKLATHSGYHLTLEFDEYVQIGKTETYFVMDATLRDQDWKSMTKKGFEKWEK